MTEDIFISPYRLTPNAASEGMRPLGSLEGLLILYHGGYSTLHPWHELGDPSLSDLLSDLTGPRDAKLVRRALAVAEIDGQFRKNNLSAFDSLETSRSHILFDKRGETTLSKGSILKIKLKSDWQEQVSSLENYVQKGYLLRLDPNCKLTFDEIITFWDLLSTRCKSGIDLVEDPCHFEENHWRVLYEKGMPIGIDWCLVPSNFECYKARIIKAARDDAFEIASQEVIKGKQLVVTSYLTHPLDQVVACWTASKLLSMYPDLVSPAGYISNAYSVGEFNLAFNGDKLIVPKGLGFGFDHVLEKLEWTRVR